METKPTKAKRGRPAKVDKALIRTMATEGYRTRVIADRCGCSARYVRGVVNGEF